MTETDTDKHRSGFLSFWGSIPGILTGLAALVTAGGTAYLATSGGDDPAPVNNPPANVFVLPAGSTPEVPDDVGESDLRHLGEIENSSYEDAAVTSAADGCAEGNPYDCEQLLDELLTGCGPLADPYACNELFWVSPVGSELEYYGATCGERVEDESYAGECELL